MGMIQMAHSDMIVIGASAGGITALKKLVSCLPQELQASMFVVLHLGTYSSSTHGGACGSLAEMYCQSEHTGLRHTISLYQNELAALLPQLQQFREMLSRKSSLPFEPSSPVK